MCTSHTTRNEGGLGIGLALVQGLVQLHDGEVKAESEGEGRGSRFIVFLPARQASDSLDEGSAAHALVGLRILFVEDNADARVLFASLLEMEGAQVVAASSGQEALALADSHDVDLIISDIGMPGMDGYMLMSELRKKPRTASVPAIALTGYGREQDVERARGAGFTTHLNKPVDLKQLKERVVKLSIR